MNCPICTSYNISICQNDLYDDRFGFPSKFNYHSCLQCGHLFSGANFSEGEIIQLYSSYYPRSTFKMNDFEPFLETQKFEGWLAGDKRMVHKWVGKNSKVLDIGCGTCQSLEYHVKRGCEVWGVEADENIRSFAQSKGFSVKIGTFDSNDYEVCFFDYITLDQVLEHLIDPLKSLKEITKVLKDDGFVIISIPNAKGWGCTLFRRKWINWHIPYHLHLFSKNSITKALRESGLEVHMLKTITCSDWLFSQFLHFITIPQFRNKSIFWNGRLEDANRKQKILIRIVFYLKKAKVFDILTRFFDMLGLGDNLLIVAKKMNQF
jgi:SAM-dependent methyltransferase